MRATQFLHCVQFKIKCPKLKKTPFYAYKRPFKREITWKETFPDLRFLIWLDNIIVYLNTQNEENSQSSFP